MLDFEALRLEAMQAVFFILLSWAVQFLLVASMGHLSLWILDRSGRIFPRAELNPFRAFWVGLAVTVALAQAYSLFLPLNGAALAAYALLALMGAPMLLWSLRGKASLSEKPQGAYWLRSGIFIVAAVMIVAAGAARTAMVTRGLGSDTDLYHLSAVRWAKEYPAVPGLANLHHRLGLNSGYFLYVALMDHGWWALRSTWIVPGLWIVAACLQWLAILFSKDHIVSLRVRLYCLMTLPFLLILHTSIQPILYYDNPAHVLQLVLMAEFLALHARIFDRPPNDDPAARARSLPLSLLVIIMVAALGFSVKPSGAVSLALAALVVAATIFKVDRGADSRKARVRIACLTFILPAFLLIGYVARNVLLSGWPLYPVPIGKFPVDWATPYCIDLYHAIKGWARLPGPDAGRAASEGFSFWFPAWYATCRNSTELKMLWAGGAFLIALCLIKAKKPRLKAGDLMEGFWIGCVALNLVFWLYSAPDFRFGNVFFWMWMSVTASMLFACGLYEAHVAKLMAVALFAVMMIILRGIDFLPRQRPTLWEVGKAQPNPTRLVTVRNGQTPPLQVRVPESELLGCGDAELPCAPAVSDSLLMRRPGNLRYGFRIKPPDK